MKLSPALAGDALEDDDGEAERGGEAERDRDHQRQRCEDAPQQQDQDQQDHPGSDRKDEQHVAVDGVAHVGKGSGLAADGACAPTARQRRARHRGAALGQVERLVREWARSRLAAIRAVLPSALRLGPERRERSRRHPGGLGELRRSSTPSGSSPVMYTWVGFSAPAGNPERRSSNAWADSVSPGSELRCRSRRCSGTRWRRARAAPRPKRARASRAACDPLAEAAEPVVLRAPSASLRGPEDAGAEEREDRGHER